VLGAILEAVETIKPGDFDDLDALRDALVAASGNDNMMTKSPTKLLERARPFACVL
jgi:hypothetical protein